LEEDSPKREITKKAKDLIKSSTNDIKQVEKLWRFISKIPLQEITNTTPTSSEVIPSSKKRKTMPLAECLTNYYRFMYEWCAEYSVSRSEVYKEVEFEAAKESELLHQPIKTLKLPSLVEDYIESEPRPTNKATEENVQSWFNGLMEASSTEWRTAVAVDTHLNAYLGGYMPDISIFDCEDSEDGAFIATYARTTLEIKKQKKVSGLTDEDKGQLLDYIYILVKEQPSRQLFSAFLSDGVFFYVVTYNRENHIYKELNLSFKKGIILFCCCDEQYCMYTNTRKNEGVTYSIFNLINSAMLFDQDISIRLSLLTRDYFYNIVAKDLRCVPVAKCKDILPLNHETDLVTW
ncbi:2821_t:CDS:2, partial [Dentiscutata erythropus]